MVAPMNRSQKIRLFKKNRTENDFRMNNICPFEEKPKIWSNSYDS